MTEKITPPPHIMDAVLTWRAATSVLDKNPQYHYAVAKQIGAREHGIAVRDSLTCYANGVVPVLGSPEGPRVTEET